MKYLEKILKALGNKRRLAILALLKKQKEATVGDISQVIKLSFTATSQHLAILRSVDIVERDQRSLEVYYSLGTSQSRIVKNILTEL
jgi:ArsR family transcriptional regulator, virulence genes transcriptional regulator